MAEPLLIAKNPQTELVLLPDIANRHGLIAGATGTGKTVTLQVSPRAFRALGVPVFMADVKGDLSGITQPGAATPKLQERLKLQGSRTRLRGLPGRFLGRLRRAGPSRPRDRLRDGPVAAVARARSQRYADGRAHDGLQRRRRGGCCCSISRTCARCCNTSAKRQELQTKYGNISAASIGAIQRGLLALEQQGAEKFFGEPALNSTTSSGPTPAAAASSTFSRPTS